MRKKWVMVVIVGLVLSASRLAAVGLRRDVSVTIIGYGLPSARGPVSIHSSINVGNGQILRGACEGQGVPDARRAATCTMSFNVPVNTPLEFAGDVSAPGHFPFHCQTSTLPNAGGRADVAVTLTCAG